jgi:transcriptional regulator with XRE-family HTH domain
VSHANFARQLGVSRQLLSRWVNDPDRPAGEDSLQKIADVAGLDVAWLRYGTGAPSGRRDALQKEEPVAFASPVQSVVTADVINLGGPGENLVRKRELLEGYRAYNVAAGRPVPDWWYELKRRIEAGEI